MSNSDLPVRLSFYAVGEGHDPPLQFKICNSATNRHVLWWSQLEMPSEQETASMAFYYLILILDKNV